MQKHVLMQLFAISLNRVLNFCPFFDRNLFRKHAVINTIQRCQNRREVPVHEDPLVMILAPLRDMERALDFGAQLHLKIMRKELFHELTHEL